MTDIMSALHETYLYGGGCHMDNEHLAELLNQIDELKHENEDLKNMSNICKLSLIMKNRRNRRWK